MTLFYFRADVTAENIYSYFQNKNCFLNPLDKKLQKAMIQAEKVIAKKNYHKNGTKNMIQIERSNLDKSFVRQAQGHFMDEWQKQSKSTKPSLNKKQNIQKNKKELIFEKIKKNKQIYAQKIKQSNQYQKNNFAIIKQQQSPNIQQQKSNTCLNLNIIKIIDSEIYLHQHQQIYIAKDKKIGQKLEQAIIQVLRTQDSSKWEHKLIKKQIKQALEIHGDGLTVQNYISNKISNKLNYLRIILSEKQSINYKNQIQSIQNHLKNIKSKIEYKFFGIQLYRRHQRNYNKKQPKIQEQIVPTKRFSRSDTLKIILNYLKSNFSFQDQQLLKNLGAQIEGYIFQSPLNYSLLSEKMESQLKSRKDLSSLKLDDFKKQILTYFQ